MENAQKTAMLSSNAMRAMAMAPDQPWNVKTPGELGPCIMRYIQRHESYFRRWAESWFMTMQYVFGNHNMRWMPRLGFAVDYDDLRGNRSGKPTLAYTNAARIAIESLVSGLYGGIPSWDIEATSDGAVSGRRQKKVIGGLLDGLYSTLMMDKDVGAGAFVFGMFGQMAFDSSWNPMAGRILELPRYQQQRQPVFTSYMAPNPVTGGLIETPTMVGDVGGRPYLEDRQMVVKDAMGRDVIDRFFTGNPEINVRTPFQYRREIASAGMHKTRFVQTFDLVDYDKWLDYYGQIGGKTSFFGNIQPVFGNALVYDFALRFFMRMACVVPPSEDDFGARWGLAIGQSLQNKVLVINHYDEPHPTKWPYGRRVVVSNGFCTHVTRPDYNTGKMDGWHPLSEAQWMNCYPSSIASGPMQDVVRKNREVNVLDTYISLAARRSLGGQTLIAHKAGLDPERLTGEPGLSHLVTDPWAVRILHDEIPIPPVVAQIRAAQMDDIYNGSGAMDAQRGSSADNAKSGYQAKINEEREDKRLSPARKQFRTALAGAGEKMIAALHKNVVHLDDALIGYVLTNAAGEFTADDVLSFLKRPLPLGTQVKIVESSMILRSKATKQATMQEVAQGPAAQRLGQDAKVLDRYLKEFELDMLRDSSGPHRDRAERENETFLDMARLGFGADGMAKPIVLFEDDDDIHQAEHGEFIIKHWDEVRENKAFLLEFYIHMETHRMQGDEKKAKLMPGTSLETGAMVQQASQVPKPSLQTIGLDAQNRRMQQAQNPGQGAGASAPPQPGAPPGAKPTSPGAPAQTTKPARQNAPAAQGTAS